MTREDAHVAALDRLKVAERLHARALAEVARCERAVLAAQAALDALTTTR